ncbi:hypothetical protein ACE02Z_13345 [Shewanella xiamenensis]|uniref:hypothetical protein n=1 Tax=Shewanella xiamenensis TaxID=332186 RepID=UPI00313AD310
MAKTLVMGTVVGFQVLTSKQGKIYGYNLGIASEFTNKYGKTEERITDVRYSDRTKNDVERMAMPLIGKEVYVEVYVTPNEFNGTLRVEYNYQPETPIIDANLSDPYGNARPAQSANSSGSRLPEQVLASKSAA